MLPALKPSIPPGEPSSSPQDGPEVFGRKALSSSTCCFIAQRDSFDTVMAKSSPDCKHCSARKEAIIKLISNAATRLAAKSHITWHSHDITNLCDDVHIQVLEGKSESDPAGFSETIELFFLENNSNNSLFCPKAEDKNSNLRRIPPFDTSSEASLQFALSCIRECTKNHADCGSNLEQLMPTRVLFVGTSESPILYLHESKGESSRYVCLSHCWGKQLKTSPMLQTTTETITCFKIQIAWSQLPKTFRDVIYFIRRMGIKYLWIDSLCIIQDDTEDKAREIGQMASVYSNAFLTIAATSASSPSEGLFSTTSSSHIAEELPKSAWDPETSDYGPLYVRREMPHIWSFIPDFPLLKRGWVFQERFLSRRVLHFTKEELIWECMLASGCECRSPTHSWQSQKRDFMPLEKSINRSTRYSTWAHVVQMYSSMRLTYNADTLPGLSGLANVWKKLYPDQYLSGLWGTSLVKELLWRRYSPCAKPLEYQAPTWSWASCPIGTTSYFTGGGAGFHELSKVSDACCIPTFNADPTGMVSSGYIRLAAKAAPGKLSFQGREGSSDLSPVDFRGRRGYVSVDCFPKSEELDVYVVAIGIQGMDKHEIADRTLHFLILSSNEEYPETFQRRGHYQSQLYMKEMDLIPDSEGYEWWKEEPPEWWTADEIKWWTSKAGDGWTEFTIV